MTDSKQAEDEKRKVFLGGLSFDTREDDIHTDFGKFGELESVSLPESEPGKHKGFAFVTYAKAEDAQDACDKHHQKQYMGREISARIVVPRDEGGGGRGGGSGGGGYGGGGGYDRNLPELSAEMNDKLEEWVAAKRRRDFETSDRIREEMKDQGVNPEQYRPARQQFQCASCAEQVPRERFSKNQLSKGAQRRCSGCVGSAAPAS